MKTIKIFVIVILVILILPLIGYAGWLLKKGKPLDIFVVNKSMTQYQGSENKAFNYLLNTKKIFATGQRAYNLRIDHFGVQWYNGDFQVKYPRLKELKRTAEKCDLFYYADASGVNTSDIRKLKAGEPDKVEYGGINNTDYNLIKEVISLNKPIILECNFYGPPTDPLVRYNIEKLIDIYYVGWIGKYVDDLAGDADLRPGFDWKELYSEYTGGTWSASGPGIVWINVDARRIFVLEEGKHIATSDGLILSTPEAAEKFGMREQVNFNGWFTLLHPGNNEILSEFQLNATDEGLLKLNEFGVPGRFPALIQAGENFYFMAGDFGKSTSNGLLPRVMVLGPLYNNIKSKSSSATNFFYSYYQPFMTSVLETALKIKNSE